MATTPSPSGTTISAPGQTLVGTGGVVWGITSSATRGNEVVRASIIDTTTANVKQILLLNGSIYHQNIANNWYLRSNAMIPPWTYQTKGDPRGTWSESPDQTVVLATSNSGSITDAQANVYSIAHGQIMLQAVGTGTLVALPPPSTGVAQLVYCYSPTHAVWAQNAALQTWWRLSAPRGPWIGPQTASPLRVVIPIKPSITIDKIGPQVAS